MPRGDESGDRAQSVLSPERFTGYVVAAWRIARPRFRAMVVPFIVVNCLISGSSIVVGLAVGDRLTTTTGLAAGAAAFLLSTTVNGLVAACCGLVMAHALVGRDVRLGEALREIGPVRGSVLAVSLYTAGIALVLQVAIPGLGYFLTLPVPFSLLTLGPLSLGPPVLLHAIALEKNSLGLGWVRTRQLLRGGLARTFLYIYTCSLALYLFVGLLFSVLGQAIVSTGLAVRTAALILAVAVGAVSAIPQVFLAALLLVAYFDGRSKAEGNFTLEDLDEDLISGDEPEDDEDEEDEDEEEVD